METTETTSVGRYVVEERLGAGAMGIVYLCQDPLLKRRVAVKITQRGHAESGLMLERFQREAEISAQLNHSNIVSVFDVGEDPTVGPFLTMEFVEGCSLGKRLEQPVPPETGLDWLTQLGRALVAAERAGVVHRDLKPENILLSKDGEVKLTDFGLARDDASRLTQTGTMVGTPTHTAPELLGGARATPATDRWAFSVLAFQMFLGGLPHPGETLSSVLNHIAREQPAIPQGTPAPLARVFFKALHKDPTRRFPNVLTFLEALAEALGLRQQLVTKGLEGGAQVSSPVVPPPASPSETEAFALPAPQPAPARGSPSARLTGPPKALLKGTAEPLPVAAPPPPPQAESPRPLQLLRPAPDLPASARTSSDPGLRSWKPSARVDLTNRHLLIVAGAIILLGVPSFLYFPRELVVQTQPPAASLLIDGKPAGTSPYKGSANFGTHMLELRLDGYDTIVKEFQGGDGPFILKLEPATSFVDLVTIPEGATVVVGTRSFGASPCKGIPVPDSASPLIVTLPGYRRWQGVLGPGQRPALPIRLQRD